MISVTTRAPGRVNIIGEHTDYTGGFVFPMAIELGVTARVSLRDDNIISISSNQMPDTVQFELSELNPESDLGWASYVAGSIWSVNRHYPIGSGLDISLEADLPLGAGMSSSAAVECSVILALAKLFDIQVPKRELAQWAKDAENLFVGVPTGSMDQVASFFGKAGHALFFDTRDDLILEIPINLADQDMVFAVIDTRVKHALIDGGYAARRADCELASELLQVNFLRDVTDLNLAISKLETNNTPPRVIRRLRHVVTENQRVLEAVEALNTNNLMLLGNLMSASHVSLRDDFEVSCPELNLAVETAVSEGALGARMMGGGFGGSAIALISSENVSSLTDAVTDAFMRAGFTSPMVYLVSASEGAHVVDVIE